MRAATGTAFWLRACIIEIQDFERALEPDLPAGEAMADADSAPRNRSRTA